jgi:hypothetical protein
MTYQSKTTENCIRAMLTINIVVLHIQGDIQYTTIILQCTTKLHNMCFIIPLCIYRASDERIFCDLELEINHKNTILTHNCIVEARARRFYLRFCAGKQTKTDKDIWRVTLPFGVSENLISDFLK